MKAFLTILFLLFSGVSVAQNEDVIESFTATEFNGKVLLTWSVKKGNTCNGVDILHLIDSVNFTKIGSIEGICGSSSASIPYDFTHLHPKKNAINYYRLSLGGVGFSKIVGAEVLDLSGANYQLRPNPVTDFSELFFANESAQLNVLNVYSSEGVNVYQTQTQGDLFLLDALDFDQGIYFFSVNQEGEDPKITGKFLVY